MNEILKISTHTPHARRDAVNQILGIIERISTHTPHARRDGLTAEWQTVSQAFQLTRLMRGVTNIAVYQNWEQVNFNSHASCEA